MYDVIVLGLGGMGSAAAYHLASRGMCVLGLEKFGTAHGFGSSHGDSRIIRQAYFENPNYVPLARRAYQLWERLERDSNCSFLRRTGGLMIGSPESSVVSGSLVSATQHDLQIEVLTADEIRRRFPVLNPRPEDIAVYEPAAGYLRPEACIQAHLHLAARHGAELHFHEQVMEWTAHPCGDHVMLKTDVASYQAPRLVIAPGAWGPKVLSDLHLPFEVRRHVMCWFEPVSNAGLFQPDQFPVYVWETGDQQCFYGMPATGSLADGVKAAVHSGGERCTADDIDRDVHDADIAEVRGYLERFIPALNGPVLRAATCMYTLTPDQDFVVAIHPRHPQVCVAAGFSGHGFKFSAAIGEILADLAINGCTTQPVEFLSPTRFDS